MIQARFGYWVVAGALALGTLAVAGCDLFGNKDSSSPGGGGNFTSYEGTWHLFLTPTAVGGRCGNDPIGVEKDIGSFTVDSSGNFLLPSGDPGSIDLVYGIWTITLLADPPGQGTCPAGSAAGTCSSFSFCSGTYSDGGDTGIVRWRR